MQFHLVILAKLFVIVGFSVRIAAPTHAADDVIAYESFSYTDGAELVGQTGGEGWRGGWFASPGTKGITIDQRGMTFSSLETHGGKSRQDGRDTRLFRHLDASRAATAALVEEGAAGPTFGKDGTTIWISFLIANTSFPKQAHGGMHLMDGVTLVATYKKTQRLQLGRQNMGTHWLLVRVDQGGPAAGRWDGTVVSDNTVRLLIYRFDFKPGPEEGWMWVDPSPGRDPDVAVADLHAPEIADFRFNAVNVGSGGGATFDFDELRVAPTFAAVAPTEGNKPRN